MEHREYIRVVEGSSKALLCIHGIVGTPDHFDPLLPLVPEDWSVFNILLDGHGGGVKDFSGTSMKKWEEQVGGYIARLSDEYESVFIAAHSMGTLFAIEAAVENRGRIKGLFLMAPPLRVGLRLYGVLNSLRLVFGRIREDEPSAVATMRACSISTDKRLWMYLGWIPRYLELFDKIRRVRGLLPQLATPCTAVHSWNDELVSNRSWKILIRYPQIKTLLLKNSGHFYYPEGDLEKLKAEFNYCLSVWNGI